MSVLQQMESTSCPDCPICSSHGNLIYEELEDRLFNVPGLWNISKCSNSKCGLLWLNPMPTETDIPKAYAHYYTHDVIKPPFGLLNRIAEAASEGYVDVSYGYKAQGNRLLKVLMSVFVFLHPGRKVDVDYSVIWQEKKSEGRLLEVGCGSGHVLKHMQSLGWNVTGVDFDPKAVAFASNQGLDVRLGSLAEQSFQSNYFDLVFMSHVIEHVHAPLALLKASFEVLKPGGRLVLLTPNSESLWHRVFGRNWMSLDPPRHLHLFNKSTITQLASRLGFTTVSVQSIVRDANGGFLGSRNIMVSGRHDMSNFPSFRMRLIGRWAQFIEWLINLFLRNHGEDILLIAEK